MDKQKNLEVQLELQRMESSPVSQISDSDKSKSNSPYGDVAADYAPVAPKEETKQPNNEEEVLSDGSDNPNPSYERRTTAKVIINEDLQLSLKYEKYLTIDNDDIIDKNDKIDALILQLKLPHIYALPDDEQYEIIQDKYSWIDDEDGEVDQFQYEEIQEVVNNMTSIERRHMYDTLEKYDEDNSRVKEKYKLIPAQLKTMKRYKKLKDTDKAKLKYVCCGCGVLLTNNAIVTKAKHKNKFDKYSKSWRGYVCKETQREFIFHSRLCVKFRKAKEWIRDAVHNYNSEHGLPHTAKMQIDFGKNEGLDSEFQPSDFYTTFDESQKRVVKYSKNIRKYYRECVNTDLRGYDIDEGDRFSNIPIEIKYLDQREFSVAMFRYLIREVQIKEFNLFWEFIQFSISYINTPKLISLLKESSDILFPLHDDTHTGDSGDGHSNDLINFLTIVCEGALYPIATCLYISAYLKENGEIYWNEDESEALSKHFANMATTIIEEIESEHLLAIVLETPTNMYDDDNNELSVIDIALKYKMLKFLQNHKISQIATTLWYERKIVHPKRRFGEDVSWWDLYFRLLKTPAKFYFSQCGQNLIRFVLYLVYLFLFSYVTLAHRYNYEQPGIAKDSNNLLWLFNIAAILYEFYRCFSRLHSYFSKLSNFVEFTKAILWIAMFAMRWVYPVTIVSCVLLPPKQSNYECIFSHTGSESYVTNCTAVQSDDECNQEIVHNSLSVEGYMGLWAIQCVLFWVSLVFYLQRSRSVGPTLKMIALMTQDMLNFLFLIVILWLAVSFALYYVINEDLAIEDATGQTLNGDMTSSLFFGMLTIIGTPNWTLVSNISEIIGERSLLVDAIVSFTALFGSLLLLNLLIAMLTTTYRDVRKLSVLEVNYIRIMQSYNASKDISLIPPPLNYFAFILMSVWFIIDLLIITVSGGTKMLNDWFFTPLNRNVFSAGDFIDYKDMSNNGAKCSGYVQHTFTSEMAEIAVADKSKFVHKRNIIKIQKSALTERHGQSNKLSLRFYCKYCRYFFHGDQVGNVEQIKNLFKYYGILLDEDDIGKLGNMLGDTVIPTKIHKKKQKKKTKKVEALNKHLSLRRFGVAQLCPECYRPFYCSEDHFDEVSRMQYLAEVCSFWVFCIFGYLPLICAGIIPAIFSYLIWKFQMIGASSSEEDGEETHQSDKILKMSESNDKFRNVVVSSFDKIRPLSDYVNDVTKRLNYIHKKIRESVADDEEDNIVTQTEEKLQLQKLVLTPKEGRKRMAQLRELYQGWVTKLDALILQIEEKVKKDTQARKRNSQSFVSPVY